MDIGDSLPVLLVTANVGSIFEDPEAMLLPWLSEFVEQISRLQPRFFALHLQEVGGKTYDESTERVRGFVERLSEEVLDKGFEAARIYLDEDFGSAQHFTALGNLYYVHKSVKTRRIWDFVRQEWTPVEGHQIHTGNIEAVATKDKSKFPQHFFPECKWSRKGYLRTRWNLNGTIVDFVNIHLFHDASNLTACESFPSVYCKSRRVALQHTLERFHQDDINGTAPYFVFGDFNFRCDTQGVIHKLTENLNALRLQGRKNADHTKVQYKNNDGELVLSVGKKEFSHSEHQKIFKQDWLRQYDRELDPLRGFLHEYPLSFVPTYPFEEDPKQPGHYMKTRCPAWCDRVLMSAEARGLILNAGQKMESTQYGVFGENTCMGDHKPVYLRLLLRTEQGTVRCRSLHQYASLDYSFVSPLLSNQNDQNRANVEESKKNQPINNYASSPVICVTDTDFNLNVCLCESMDEKDKNINTQTVMCSDCGKFRIANDGMLLRSRGFDGFSRDYIVNAIDTQLLYTIDHRYQQDPYTPESLESHSPDTEYTPDQDSRVSDELADSNGVDIKPIEVKSPGLDVSSSIKTKAVSPDQLKSRLESILRTTEHKEDQDGVLDVGKDGKEVLDGGSKKDEKTVDKKCCQCDVL